MPQPSSTGRAAFFALLPAAAGAGAMAIAPLLALAGVAALRSRVPLAAFKTTLGLLAAAWSLWTLAAIAWSPAPSALAQGARAFGTLAAGFLFASAAIESPTAARLTRAALLSAFAVLALLLAIEAGWDMPLNRAGAAADAPTWKIETNPGRGATVLLALCWGTAGALLGRPSLPRALPAVAVLAISGFFSLQFHQLANFMGFAAGLVGFAGAWLLPRVGPLLAAGGWAAWLLAAPFVIPSLAATQQLDTLPYTWAARLVIWDHVSARIRDHLWVGHGLDASRLDHQVLEVGGRSFPALPLHPHSASLQIWYELGFVGAALSAAVLAAAGLALSRAFANDRAASAAATGALLALGLLANLSYGAWQEWWLATLVVAAAAAGAAARAPG